MKFVVVYLTDNSDLYSSKFETKEEALNFIETEINECKSILVESDGQLSVENHT